MLPLCPSGLESPSHALRADALPHASSAATICVTLAEGHQCDRALEILLHPSGEMGHTEGQLWGMLMNDVGNSLMAPEAERLDPQRSSEDRGLDSWGSEAGTTCQGRISFSEPHQPHLMLEAGSLSSAEYEAQMRARHDFQRLQRRDSDGERQVWLQAQASVLAKTACDKQAAGPMSGRVGPLFSVCSLGSAHHHRG